MAVGCGLQPGLSEKATGVTARRGDSYWATLAAIDEAVLEEINAFVERRVGEGGVATDF